MSIVCTNRDHEILQYLLKAGVATRAQLQSRFFASDKSCWKRLRALEKNGFVQSETIEFYKNILKVLQPSLSCRLEQVLGRLHNRTRFYYPSKRVRRDAPSKYVFSETMLAHQILVNEALLRLNPFFKGYRVTFQSEFEFDQALTTGQLREDHHLKDRVFPDLAFQSGDRFIAVELERNLKRDYMRYFNRWDRFNHSEFTHVIYVCPDKEVLLTLSRKAVGFRQIAFTTFADIEFVISSTQSRMHISKFISSEVREKGSLTDLLDKYR